MGGWLDWVDTAGDVVYFSGKTTNHLTCSGRIKTSNSAECRPQIVLFSYLCSTEGRHFHIIHSYGEHRLPYDREGVQSSVDIDMGIVRAEVVWTV